ncbi:hypothetical protein, partial [Klebsiella oxytoca]|uniref:hypothetical protein n=1 Tax=Klebsiella oxytoca TaxID=571 RepID=UPI001C65030A
MLWYQQQQLPNSLHELKSTISAIFIGFVALNSIVIENMAASKAEQVLMLQKRNVNTVVDRSISHTAK